MYEERKEKFSFKSFFLTLLLVLLFVFLMLWLFPTKNYVDEKLQSTRDLERLSVLYDEVFANNVGRMKEAAIGYFTNERMPKVVGETKKLTLREMYDLHLVLKMKDKNGKYCSETKSYVEMTKYDEEYRLKVNLSCGEDEDYIIVYLGCYNYCPDGICEKQVSDTKPVSNPTNPSTPSNPTNPTNPVSHKYMYEYKLETKDCTNCTDWSKWQKDPIEASDSVKVETKKVEETTGYKDVTIQTGTKIEKQTYTDVERYISGYTTKLVKTGTKQIQVGTKTETYTEKVAVGTVEVYVGVDTGTKVPSNTDTMHYKVISVDKPSSCSYCTNETIYTWEIYKVETVYDVKEYTKEVPVYRTVDVYEEQTVPVYDFREVEKTKQVIVPIYETVKVPIYSKVTYYRSKTCTFVKGTTDIKWSYSNFDAELIGKGYKLTGNVKEV